MYGFAHGRGTAFAGSARRIGVLGLGASLLGCGADPQPESSLQARARTEAARQTSQSEAAVGETPTPPSAATAEPREAASPTPPASSDPAPRDPVSSDPAAIDATADVPAADPDAPAIELVLALDPKVTMRATTVGMVELPLVEKPTGFAIEESITLDHCKGAGAARTCRLHHAFTNFDAEPPAGRFLKTDHARVAELSLSHDLAADGRATSATTVEGEVEPELGEALGKAHGLHCIRLPTGPVKPGATWTDTCSEWARGAVTTREVTWTLARVEGDEGDRRAELRYRGTITQPSSAGERSGTVQGVLYVFADAGQPHLLREQVAMPLKAGGAVTKATLNVQFAKVDPKHPDTPLRMDGEPFPEPPAPSTGAAPPSSPSPEPG